MRRLMFLILAIALLCGVIPTHSVCVYAENSTSYIEAYEKTNVFDDLTSAENFNVNNYPENKNGQVSIINFVEFGYSSTGSQDNYGLFIYLYNPQKLNIDTSSVQNKIQMAIGYNKDGVPNNYFKFQLQFLNASQEEYENLFLKFKVVDIEIEGKTFVDRVDKEERRYDISGIEILQSSQNLPTEYGIGGTWKFTGYSNGFGDEEESTLQATVNELETIELEVNSTYYRPDVVSSLGMFHQNTINSVYFAVDNRLIEEYGKLQKIKAEWYEYKTTPIAVVKDSTVKEALTEYLGQTIDNGGRYDEDIPYGFYAGKINNLPTYDYSYNAWTSSLGLISPQPAINYLEKLNYIFSSNNASLTDFEIKEQDLLNYIYNYDLSYESGKLPINNISADLFQDTVDDGRIKGYNLKEIDSDDKFDMLSYDSNHSWWDKLLNYGFWAPETDGDLKNISPIQMVNEQNLEQSDEVISDSLLINLSDVPEFKTYFFEQKLLGKTVFIFRFAQTDYYSASGAVMSNGSKIPNGDMYLAIQTVFFNFDIIQLTFNREGNYTVIPVVADPINVIPDITPPLTANFDWLRLILIILIVIVLIIILAPLLPTIFKGLWEIIKLLFKIISLPFKWIASLINKGGKNK